VTLFYFTEEIIHYLTIIAEKKLPECPKFIIVGLLTVSLTVA